MGRWQGPPVLVGERALWLGSGSGLPKPGIVRWIGHLPEIGLDWTVGLELDEALPFGGIDGSWGGRVLFTCKPKHGLLVPISNIIPGSQLKHIPNISGFGKSQNAGDRSSVASLSRHQQSLPQPYIQPMVAEDRDLPKPALRHKRRIPTPPSSDSDEPSRAVVRQETETDQATLRVEEREQEDSLKKRLRLFTENNGQIQRMNRHYNECSVEEVVIDSLYAQRRQQIAKHGRSQSDSSHTFISSASSSGSRRDRSSSAIFSIFRWFRKETRSDDFDAEFAPSAPPSPQLIRGYSSSCGSVDTLFSTATASSFAFVHPALYRPFGAASPPEKKITTGPETETYRNRLRQRDRIRELDKNLTLKKKYHLFGSGTLHRSADDVNGRHFFPNKSLDSLKVTDVSPESKNSTLSRKKRKAPPPPLIEEKSKELSLPNKIENNKENADANSNTETDASKVIVNRPRHRRTVSDSAKDRKSGVFVHVRGKRKAPAPPTDSVKDEKSTNREILGTQSLGRKKRPAPPPPLEINTEETEENRIGAEGSLSPEEKQRLIKNIAKLQAHADRRSLLLTTPPASPVFSNKMSHVVCNDSLKLERGVLKANKTEVQSPEAKPFTPPPVSPRPWYKRNNSNKEKSLEKKKDKNKIEDWMPEVAIARGTMINQGNQDTNSCSNNSNSYRLSSIFSRFEKPEEKRKSQISMLVNISELDREAAEIVQKEQERERAMLAAHDAKFYNSIKEPPENSDEPPQLEAVTTEVILPESPDTSRKTGARELISLFNAIGNATKVTVNSAFFSKDGPSIFTKEGIEKRFSLSGDSVKTSEEKVFKESVSKINGYKRETVIVETKETYLESPGVKRRRNMHHEDGKNADSSSSASSEAATSKVVIEEIEEFDSEKSKIQALYEANKIRKHHSPSPSIPTIAEMSESISSVTTSPGSTINASARSTSVTPTPTPPAVFEHPPAQHTKNYSIWTCPRCTLENPRWRVTCEACDMWRPAVRRDVIDKLTNANMGSTIAVNVIKAGEPKSSCTKKSLSSQADSKSASNVIALKESTDVSNHKVKELVNKTPITTSASIVKSVTKTEPLKPLTVSGLLSQSSYKTDLSEKNNNYQSKESNLSKKKDEAATKISVVRTTESSVNSEASSSVSLASNVCDKKSSVTQQEIKTKDQKSSSPVKMEESQPSTTTTKNESDIEEVRKARLAFFKKSQSEEINESEGVIEESSNTKPSVSQAKIDALFSIASRGSLATNEQERLKVKEILKEMKNSLPKKSKQENPKTKSSEANIKSDVAIKENVPILSGSSNSSNDAVRLGAIKKRSSVSASSNITKNVSSGKPKEDKKAEVYLIKSETIIDEIKVKAKEGNKSSKVSTSVQTNGVVRKVEPSASITNNEEAKPVIGKPPTPKAARKEILVPVTVEEHVTKNGIEHTTTSKEPRKMGIGTFELLRPRDFASIEATKTGTEVKSPLVHVYANIPSTHDDDSSAASTSSSSSESPEISQLTAQLSKPKGLADFKAAVLESTAGNKMNTLAVNRLLRQLESAIAGGQHQRAATLAKELARHKVNCCVTRHKKTDTLLVDMYVEDKLSHQGPYPLQVLPTMTVAQLKAKVEKEFEIPTTVQRWILGKELAADDSATLEQLAVNKPHCPIFLYLVAPDGGHDKVPPVTAPAVNEAPKASPAAALVVEAATGATAAVPSPGRGWYFNEENDRYSFCESEVTDQSSKDSSPEPQVEPAPPQAAEVVIVEEVETEEEEEEVELGGEAEAPATAVMETPLENHTGTLAIGWKCVVCTLVNSPTRPGCLACATDRPADYTVPADYEASGPERHRMDQEIQTEQAAADDKLRNYQELMVLENADLIPSSEAFECSVCLTACAAREGVVLRDCLHTFCRACLAHTVQFTDDAEVKCPFRDHSYACDSTLQEREIKALVTPEMYEQHLAKSVAQAENKIGNTFHCKTPDCPGWCIFEDNVNTFQCPVCNQANCLTCQAVHSGMDCKQYQEQAQQEAETNADARRTTEMLEEMVKRGEALPCPTCQVVLMKKWGCDWLRCSMCKTEICWVTRGPRWGPNGKGDTSGGCQCGVNGVKCHPKCNYCH